jgi:RNA polymerase-binding transcription factor DksA
MLRNDTMDGPARSAVRLTEHQWHVMRMRLVARARVAALHHDAANLREIEQALERLENGVYGQCAACGEPIAFTRLDSRPEVARCGHCEGDRA